MPKPIEITELRASRPIIGLFFFTIVVKFFSTNLTLSDVIHTFNFLFYPLSTSKDYLHKTSVVLYAMLLSEGRRKTQIDGKMITVHAIARSHHTLFVYYSMKISYVFTDKRA